MCHNAEDLEIVSRVVSEKYPDYVKAWDEFMNDDTFIPYNMFIMKREEFLEYVKFIKNILDGYLEMVGTDIRKRIEDNKEKYLKDFYPNNTVEYQYRIGGYLAERLTNVWMMKNHIKLVACNVKITEDKYITNDGK